MNVYSDEVLKFKKEWIKNAQHYLCLGDTEYITLSNIFDSRFKPGIVVIHNSYHGEFYEVDAVKFYQNIRNKYILNEIGTLTKKHHIQQAINSIVLDEGIEVRQIHKRVKIKAEIESDIFTYRTKDSLESNTKVKINGFYGLGAYDGSSFSNKDSSETCTASSRNMDSLVTLTCEITQNGFRDYALSAYIKLIDETINMSKNISDDIINSLTKPKSDEDIVKQVLGYQYKDYKYIKLIRSKISQLNDKEKVLLYYKNNFIEFIKTPLVVEKITQIFETTFKALEDKVDPNDAYLLSVKNFKRFNSLKELKTLAENLLFGLFYYNSDIVQGVYCDSLEDKSTSMQRQETVGMDTDSGIVSVDSPMIPLMKILNDQNNEYINSIKNIDYDRFETMVSVIVATIYHAIIQKSLYVYNKSLGVSDEFNKFIEIELEYIFKQEQLTLCRKAYIAQPVMKDGHFVKKDAIKETGVQYIKSNHNQTIASKVEELIRKHVLLNGIKIDYKNMINEIREASKEANDRIRSEHHVLNTRTVNKMGDQIETYLYSHSGAKAIHLWNRLYPSNIIETPGSYGVLDLKLTEDILERFNIQHKEIYDEFNSFTKDILIYKNIISAKNKAIKFKESQELYETKFKGFIDGKLNKFITKLSEIKEEDLFKEEVLMGIYNYIMDNFSKELIKVIKKEFTNLKPIVLNNKSICSIIDILAIPVDLVEVPDFIKFENYIMLDVDKAQALEHLSGQVLTATGLVTPKNKNKNMVITNVLTTY